ncbi:ABC transporter ATP-binding protein [Nitriliruptor alkaliphilus]|uniref:ABC transporter ATP-binding protein n=1 Tax=Nitriliruptor alkaliphilus TaxID=427918 RepID=UPI000697E042|nr:ABC transporter ATP-binding protein [Nitriliruptor alkaliphilus]
MTADLELLRAVRGPLTGAIALQAAAGVLALLPIVALVAFTGAWVSGDPLPGLGLVVAAIVGTLGAALGSAAATWLAHRADADLTGLLQHRLAETIRTLPVPAVTGLGAGRVKKVVHDDTSALHYLVAHTLLDVTALVVTPLAGLLVLAVVDWRLAMLSVVPLAAGVGCYVRAMQGSREGFSQYAATQQRINAAVVDLVRGLPTAKIYGGPGGARDRYDAAVHGFHDFFRAWSRRTSAATTASWLVVAPGVTAACFALLGGIGLRLGWVSPAAFVAGILLGPTISAPVAVAGPRLQAIRTGLAALSSLAELLAQPGITWGTTEVPADARVRLDEVSHRYGDDRLALDGVSLELPERGLIALVGASGSGKSTIATLLARFADPTAGRVLLGEVDLREVREDELYERIGFVFQDTRLRQASIRDNLTGGRPIDDERVGRAARTAAIHDDVVALPNGYDTVLGDETELSGGQRQRLCLARALLREPDVLVLDETLAAVDPSLRATLWAALRAQAEQRTVLLIAHQLRLVHGADRLLVLDDGRLVGDGTHVELLRSCATYRSLWKAEVAEGEDETEQGPTVATAVDATTGGAR